MSQPLLPLSIQWAVHLLTLLLLPPLIPGLINKVKAVMAGRNGPPVFQLYYDLGKLAHKRAVFSRTTTWVFLAGPIGTVAAGLVAGLLVPFGHTGTPLSFEGDVILFAYLFGLARFLTVLSALDTGSSFEGMGAAREVAFSALAEVDQLIADTPERIDAWSAATLRDNPRILQVLYFVFVVLAIVRRDRELVLLPLIVALLYWGLGQLTAEDRKPSYAEAFSATVVSGLVCLPKFLILGLVFALRNFGGARPDALSPTSLGFYLTPESLKLQALFNGLDLFNLASFLRCILTSVISICPPNVPLQDALHCTTPKF